MQSTCAADLTVITFIYEQVRCLCVADAALITGSRDKTIKVWVEDGPTSFALVSTLVRLF